MIQAKTDADGYVSFEGVPVGDYRYIVKAAGHDDFEGKLTVEPGETPQTLGVILVTNLVDVNFTVTETTIEDRYNGHPECHIHDESYQTGTCRHAVEYRFVLFSGGNL